MKKYDDIFLSLVDDFSKHKLVEAVLLSGSRTTDNFDKNSDYDIYILIKKFLLILEKKCQISILIMLN
ncbi:nucleotidyltransferase domain-containing protein [Halocella sp. SP3-1]|uniref:nucleotidyltransferase domain-containing protein n=1 Tax=Halocella sp. SP3-1 TaxID=2382161 RepID=UPI00197A9B45|nr:nucleotidyltransferase domain-containing protein [Halocella sp. SP3-1]